MAGIGYRPEIDGLRAFAVIPVILFHMGPSLLPGGYIGVDVFFVISGFLITSLIKKDLDQGTFSFRDFWARRVRRILPAMIFVTAVTLAVTYVFVFRPDQQMIGKQGLAALLSVANIYFWENTGDYWGTAAENSPFLHAWSLSVEEQFYLFFPLAMWLVFRLRSRWLQGFIVTPTFGSLTLFLWGLPAHPTATFYLLPTRVWELGAGCLLAVSLSNPLSTTSSLGIFSTAGLAMVIASYVFIERPDGGIALAVVGTAFIIAFGQAGPCHKLLSHRAVVHIGKISYSLYLWHWPVLVLARHLGLDQAGVGDKVFVFCGIYLLALGTYHFVEKPTRRTSGIVPFILVGGALVAVSALVLGWAPRYYDTPDFDTPQWIEYNCCPNWEPQNTGLFANTIMENPKYKPDALSSGRGIRVGDETKLPQMIVLGDSHGTMWADAIADTAREFDIPTAFFVMNRAESPFFKIPPKLEGGTQNLTASEKLQFDRSRLKAIETANVKLVVIAARWETHRERDTLDLLDLLSHRGIAVLLIEDPPRLSIPNSTNVMQFLAWKKLLPDRLAPGQQMFLPCENVMENEGGRRLVRVLTENYKNVQFLPTYDLYLSGREARVINGRIPLYLDDDHVTSQGAKLIVPRLRNTISRYFSHLN